MKLLLEIDKNKNQNTCYGKRRNTAFNSQWAKSRTKERVPPAPSEQKHHQVSRGENCITRVLQLIPTRLAPSQLSIICSIEFQCCSHFEASTGTCPQELVSYYQV